MKKKVLIITPSWSNRWRELYFDNFIENGYDPVISDKYINDDWFAILFMWTDRTALNIINGMEKKCKYILFCRRYEMFTEDILHIDYSKVDEMVFCNNNFKGMFDNLLNNKISTNLIYNSMDSYKWTFKNRKNGYKIAMLCSIHPKKNIPLALYLLRSLINENIIESNENFPNGFYEPHKFELHIAGDLQEPFLKLYIEEYSRNNNLKVKVYNKLDINDVDAWLEDKNYILSTSISEGNPNNVLEAMTKGIKPVVHNWLGAKDQFGEYTFESIEEAKKIIKKEYNSLEYKNIINSNYNFKKNFKKVLELIE